MKHITKLILALGMIMVFLVGCSANQSIAVVNGEKITEEKFYEQLKMQYGQEVLDRMINDLLIRQEAKKNNITVTKEEIAKELSFIKEQYGSEETFNTALKESNVTLQQLEESIENKTLYEKLATKDVKIDMEVLKEQYTENLDLYYQKEQVRASHILVATKEEGEAILSELEKGADFAKLAEEKSLDNYSKVVGGDLGFFERGQMVKEFEDMAFSLNKGQVSGLVKSEYGYHIIKVIDKKEPKQLSFDEVKDEIEQEYKEEHGKNLNDLLSELRANAKIETKLGNR